MKTTQLLQYLRTVCTEMRENNDPYNTTSQWIVEYLANAYGQDDAEIPNFYILPTVRKPIPVGRPIAAEHSWYIYHPVVISLVLLAPASAGLL